MAKLHYLEEEYILENYSIFGPKIISKKLNRSEKTIINFAKKNNLILQKCGLSIEDAPDFLVNLNFYSILEEKITPELAYWIGFTWADGSVNKSSIRIEITKEDGEILKETFNKIFPFSISYRERSGRKPQMTFSVNSKETVELLFSLGKYPKTSESHEKIFNYLNDEELWIYFLRGLIDGDGNFYINEKEKYAQFTIASNYNQDWTFLNKILNKFNPNFRQFEEKRGSKGSHFKITGRENLINFINYLKYPEITIGLLRKQEKANAILELYKNNPPKEVCKKVYQYSKNNELIHEYSSAKEASELTKIGISSIRNCINGLSKTAGGYIWSYNIL